MWGHGSPNVGQAVPPAGPVGEDADPTKERLQPGRAHFFRAKARKKPRRLAHPYRQKIVDMWNNGMVEYWNDEETDREERWTL